MICYVKLINCVQNLLLCWISKDGHVSSWISKSCRNWSVKRILLVDLVKMLKFWIKGTANYVSAHPLIRNIAF